MRPLLFAAAGAAIMVLAACDQPNSVLSKSEVGECYERTGTGSLGEPKFEKRPCSGEVVAADSSASEQAAPDTPEAEATPAGEEPAPVLTALAPGGAGAQASAQTCVQVPVCAAPGAGAGHVATSSVRPKVAAGKSATRRRATVTRKTTSHSSGGSRDYVGLGIDYARVGDDRYSSRQTDTRQTDSRQTYSSSSADYSSRSQASYSEQSSASYSGSAAASGYGYSQTGGCCNQQRGAPPHATFDQYGYLNWAGKVQYQPGGRR